MLKQIVTAAVLALPTCLLAETPACCAVKETAAPQAAVHLMQMDAAADAPAANAPAADGMEMTPEMMKAMTPGEAHQMLAEWVGDWSCKSEWRMSPKMDFETGDGTLSNQLILDGRFIKGEFKGDMGGMPFEGIAITGYDTLAGKWQNVWMDSMMTAMMTSTGTSTDGGKTVEYTGKMMDCMTGKESTFRYVYKIVSDDKHVMEMYTPDPTGKEFKSGVMTYTR